MVTCMAEEAVFACLCWLCTSLPGKNGADVVATRASKCPESLLLLFCFVPILIAHKWGFLSSELVGLVLSPSSLGICCSGSLSWALTDAWGKVRAWLGLMCPVTDGVV